MAIYTPQKRLKLVKALRQYGQTAPHQDDFSAGKLYWMGIIRSDETTGYTEPLPGHTSRYDPATVGSPPYPMTWVFWPYYSDGRHLFYFWVNVNGTPTRHWVNFGDSIWDSLGTTRIFEVVWDKANHRLISFTNGKYANANTNTNLGYPLWDTSNSIMRIGAAPSSGAPWGTLGVRYELLVIHNDFPWWYNPTETTYHKMDHFLYLDPTNPIPMGTEPRNPGQFLHCYTFNEIVNGAIPDLGSAGVNIALYNSPELETGMAGIWADEPPPVCEVTLDCSSSPSQDPPASFTFNCSLNGNPPEPGTVQWFTKMKDSPNWTITMGDAQFVFNTSQQGIWYVKASVGGDESEIVKVYVQEKFLQTEVYLDCSSDPAQSPPASFLFHATSSGNIPQNGTVSWFWKERSEASWHTISGENADFIFDSSYHNNTPGVYYVKASIEGDESEIVKVSIYQYSYIANVGITTRIKLLKDKVRVKL